MWSCHRVTFSEVIEGILASDWDDSPNRETRFPRNDGALSPVTFSRRTLTWGFCSLSDHRQQVCFLTEAVI